MNPETQPPLAGATGSALCWEWSSRVPGRLRGFLPAIPGTTLFLIDLCPDKPHRGRLMGALIPDDEDGREHNDRALVVGLKHRAEMYLRDWDEARAKQSTNAKRERPAEGRR